MSDLQDIIAHTAQKAYQEGLRREREQWQARLDRIKTWNPESHQAFLDGVIHEQDRIIALLNEIRNTWTKPVSFNYLAELDSIIERVQTSLPSTTLQRATAEDSQ
jgi:hypothetical protein